MVSVGTVWLWGVSISLLMFVASLIALPAVIIYLPDDFLTRDGRDKPPRHPIVRIVMLTVKNCAGATLVVLGVAMLFTPGQGLLAILVGLVMIDFPGKRVWIRRIVGRPAILRSVNKIRMKAGRGPVRLPVDES